MQVIAEGLVDRIRPDGDDWRLCIAGDWHTLGPAEFFHWWHSVGRPTVATSTTARISSSDGVTTAINANLIPLVDVAAKVRATTHDLLHWHSTNGLPIVWMDAGPHRRGEPFGEVAKIKQHMTSRGLIDG